MPRLLCCVPACSVVDQLVYFGDQTRWRLLAWATNQIQSREQPDNNGLPWLGPGFLRENASPVKVRRMAPLCQFSRVPLRFAVCHVLHYVLEGFVMSSLVTHIASCPPPKKKMFFVVSCRL